MYVDTFSEELDTILCEIECWLQSATEAHNIPFALRGTIKEELDHLEREGIIEKVTHSEWATPIVAVIVKCTFVGTSRWQ